MNAYKVIATLSYTGSFSQKSETLELIEIGFGLKTCRIREGRYLTAFDFEGQIKMVIGNDDTLSKDLMGTYTLCPQGGFLNCNGKRVTEADTLFILSHANRI